MAVVGLLYWAVLAPGLGGGEPRKLEPSVLERRAIPESFGFGEGVDFVREDQKIFDFEVITPVRAMGILRLQARDLSAGEVVVTCNAREVGQVPPDTEDKERILELVIPASVLKLGETNQCIFDNTKNPPGRDTWRIWNISVDTWPLPERPLDQLRADAEASFQRGLRNMERKAVGAENLYNAWKEFREAWLLLESHPDPRPPLYELARTRVREAQYELNHTCSRLMLEVEMYYNQQKWDEARATLDHVKAYFPNENDQPCRLKAEQMRYEYKL